MNAEERVARQWWWMAQVSWVLNHKLLLGWWLLLGLALAGDIGVVWLALRSARLGP